MNWTALLAEAGIEEPPGRADALGAFAAKRAREAEAAAAAAAAKAAEQQAKLQAAAHKSAKRTRRR